MSKKPVIATLVLIIFLFLGSFLIINKDSNRNVSNQLEHSDFPFLAKRLFVDNPSETIINFSDLRTNLNNYFKDNDIEGSLYFEYLPTGTSIRINGNDEFRAASLMKLPVAMEVYKAKEKGLLNLDDEVTLQQEWLNNGYGDLYKEGAGYRITYRELVKILLVDSDNTALRALIDSTSRLEIQDRALGALDVELTQGAQGEIDIGTRSYSSFLKCLYFACYNTKEQSQEILEYLSQSDFDDKIVAGVDKGTTVSHKIGVFNDQVQGDCGIVYLVNKNYILCIMLKENQSQDTSNHFQQLSKQTFDFLKSL